MARIKVLDQNTINQIAAGEVVERPASIVKELIENSIDAGATAITVEIQDGGLKMIRITDNGSGIEKEDIQNAFIRHSTSKIHNVEDLLKISSLGFRGEALASIAAVSQVELMTKIDDDLTGIRYVIHGGDEQISEEIGCPVGTTFIVNNLFYNTPARKKFLKSPKAEAGYIADFLNKLALGNPSISFKFINNHQVKLHTSGNNDLKDCIFRVFDKEITRSLIPIQVDEDVLTIKGFIGKPNISRANRNHENYYLNGRYIKSKVVQNAIEDAYKSKLTIHRYPFTTFFLSIDPKLVDVNVHPNKMEVRFNQEDAIYQIIYQSIKEALDTSELIPVVSLEKKDRKEVRLQNTPEPFEENRRKQWIEKVNNNVPENSIVKEKSNNSFKQVVERQTIEPKKSVVSQEILSTRPVEKENSYVDTNNNNSPKDPEQNNVYVHHDKGIKSSETGEQLEYKHMVDTTSNGSSYKIIGQLFKTYWIVELENKYYMIDQHAAHERVLYEKILSSLENKNMYSQGLLQPIVVQLSLREKERYESYQQLFQEIGFEIEEFGTDALIIRQVPYIFEKPIDPKDFLLLLDRLQDTYNPNRYEELLHDIATMACKAAVKAHDSMTTVEYEKLIRDLFQTENPYSCPHGRPTMISMTRYELEKKFKRIQ